MVLVSGHALQATKVACNLPDVVVGRSQAMQNGDYLFVWLKFGPQMRSGTVVCRATTPTVRLPSNCRSPLGSRRRSVFMD